MDHDLIQPSLGSSPRKADTDTDATSADSNIRAISDSTTWAVTSEQRGYGAEAGVRRDPDQQDGEGPRQVLGLDS